MGKVSYFDLGDKVVLETEDGEVSIPFAGEEKGIRSIDIFGSIIYENESVYRKYFRLGSLDEDLRELVLSQGQYFID